MQSLIGPMGQLFASHPWGAVVQIPGMQLSLQWNQVLLLAMSHYNSRVMLREYKNLPSIWEVLTWEILKGLV